MLMNEALIQSEWLTASGTGGTNSFAALLRNVGISPEMSQMPVHFEKSRRAELALEAQLKSK